MIGIIIAANSSLGGTALVKNCWDALYEHTTMADVRVFLADGVQADDVSQTWNDLLALAYVGGCTVGVVLNSDTRVTEGWLPPLVKAAKTYDLAGPCSNNCDGNEWQHRESPNGPGRRMGMAQVPDLNGFALAARMDWWMENPFDPSLFLGVEGELIRRSGARCGVAYASFIEHTGKGTRRPRERGE
jgi:hypothetical protein